MELQKRDFRAMMYLHYRQGKLAVDSFQILHTIFGDQGPSKATIFRWFAAFKIGKTNLEDDPRTGRPASAVTQENIDAVERMIDEDRRVTYQQIQEELGISSAATNIILREKLGVRKLVSRWIPHLLTEEQKQKRLTWCKFMKEKFREGQFKLVWDILTGDETWIYQFDPETKHQSTVCVFEGEDPPMKCRRSRSENKKMIASFFMRSGHIELVVLEDRCTVNAEWYTEICLDLVFEAVTNKRPATGTRGLLLHHDNASAHTAAQAIDFLAEHGIQLVTHPPYSPDLAPCDYFLFPKCKERLCGQMISSPDEAVHAYMDTIGTITPLE